MTAALRLVDLAMSMAPTISPAPPSAIRPSFVPTLVPNPRLTLLPSSRMTEAPSTQRSATVHPRHEVKTLLNVMRQNIGFLESLLNDEDSSLAVRALDEIHATMDSLEQRFSHR